VLVVALVLSSCTSSTKLLEHGDYDSAINKSIKKLLRDSDNPKEIKVLKKSWQLANDNNLDRINKLKLSGQPDIWKSVNDNYVQLDSRQDRVRRLPDAVLRKINFVREDYSSDLAATLKKAVDFNYKHAKMLLSSGTKEDARTAYNELMFIKEKMPNYMDVNAKLEQAHTMGTNYVLFQIENSSNTVLPKNYEEQILKISISDLNEQWVAFDNYSRKDFQYDFYIDLLLKEINVSPELIQKEKIVDSKDVEDGWEYVLDANGNVMKDSLGNDIKKTKHVTIKAYVTKNDMSKRAQVKGTLDYYDSKSGQLIKTFPITTEFAFEHHFATFEGDEKALSKSSYELVKNKPVPFPSDAEIIFDTSDELKRIAFDRIKRDRNLFLD